MAESPRSTLLAPTVLRGRVVKIVRLRSFALPVLNTHVSSDSSQRGAAAVTNLRWGHHVGR